MLAVRAVAVAVVDRDDLCARVVLAVPMYIVGHPVCWRPVLPRVANREGVECTYLAGESGDLGVQDVTGHHGFGSDVEAQEGSLALLDVEQYPDGSDLVSGSDQRRVADYPHESLPESIQPVLREQAGGVGGLAVVTTLVPY